MARGTLAAFQREIVMPRLRLLKSLIVCIAAFAAPAWGQDALPDHRYLFTRDVDFYGADLTNQFDTTQAS